MAGLDIEAQAPLQDLSRKNSALGDSIPGSVASAVSRLFCFSPDLKEIRQNGSTLDLQSSMSLSLSPGSYAARIAPTLLPETQQGSSETQTSEEGNNADEACDLESEFESPFAAVAATSSAGKTRELPFDVTAQILRYCDTAELQAAHLVSRDWRNAARLSLKNLSPSTLDMDRIASFPMVECLHLECHTIKSGQLTAMKTLKALGLKNCTFKHPASDLASMKMLEKLKMRDVNFCEPDGLDACRLIPQLTSLTHLEISRCSEMHYCMPNVHFKSLKNLQKLVVNDAGMGVKLTFMTELSSLDNLRELSLSKSMVDFDIARSIGRLSQLERLELMDVSLFNDASLTALARLINLKHLDLRTIPDGRSEIRGGISVLANMEQLTYLNLTGHGSLAGENLSMISQLTDLKYLSISGVNLGAYSNGEGPAFLSALTGLTTLNLYGTLMKASQFHVLRALKLLRTLDTSHTFLDSAHARHIAAMKDLQILRINYCPVTNEGLHSILDGCPHLSYIRTDGCWISTLGMLTAMCKRPKLVFWSKSDMKHELCPRPRWYRQIELIVSVRVQPEHTSLRSFWVKEKSWPASVGVAAVVLLIYASWLSCWLFLLVILSVLPVVGVIGFGCIVAPILFFTRLGRGAFKHSLQAMPDAYDWLYHKLFPSLPRTAEDRLAELV